jgi:hypothetical protein
VANPFDQFDDQPDPRVLAPGNPNKPRKEQLDLTGSSLSNKKTAEEIERDRRNETRNISNDKFAHVTKLANDFNGDAAVKTYRVAIGQLAQALNTGGGPQADLALTYAFAKAMDPDSVVRDAEQGMVTDSQPWLKSAVENVKKQFGMDGAGQYTPATREALRKQIINSVSQRVKTYDARRDFFTAQAKELDIPAELVVGEHDAKPFLGVLEQFNNRKAGPQGKAPASVVDEMIREGRPYNEANAFAVSQGLKPISPKEYNDRVSFARRNPASTAPLAVGDYDQSVLSQGLSGVNEGIAGVAGLPVDLATGALNLIPRGVNALANTDLPTIQNPILGSEWLKGLLGDAGAIRAPAATPGAQFARRTGESIGASAIPAGAAGSLLRGVGQLAVGLGGGLGGASAQQMFPGNPVAELGGEVLGSGGAGLGLLNAGRRSAVRQMEAQVPTIPQLKERAGELYRSAEGRGIVADPAATQTLSDDMRAVLAREGRISPTGRISEVYPKAREGMQLIDDYAGTTMSPTQMQTVRGVVADGLKSPDSTERRLSGMLTERFDDWARPMAPELDEARDVASRYLTAEQLQQARELAGARASQFTGSGFENALRTEYRGLDRGAIKGSKRFSDDVTGAIETVARGTPTSNALRGLGRLAPTGPMSLGLGSVSPAIGAGLLSGSPTLGAATGALAAGLGTAGRLGATHMGIRNADRAELIARNGGQLPAVPFINPDDYPALYSAFIAQAAKYLPSQ